MQEPPQCDVRGNSVRWCVFLHRSHPRIKGRAGSIHKVTFAQSGALIKVARHRSFKGREMEFNSTNPLSTSRFCIFSNLEGGKREIRLCISLARSSSELNSSEFERVPTRITTGRRHCNQRTCTPLSLEITTTTFCRRVSGGGSPGPAGCGLPFPPK